MSAVHPFDLLADFEQRVKQSDISIPDDDQITEWVGLGFRTGGDRLMADMGEVKEILEFPDITAVPGVKSWIVGVANVRGSLLPVLDLKGFLSGENLADRRKGRIIVIEYKGFNTGLVVDEIFGMRHFREVDRSDRDAAVDEKVSPYVTGVYQLGDEHWPVFSFERVKQDERFAVVSL